MDIPRVIRTNVNESNNVTSNDNVDKVVLVDQIADRLITELGNNNYREYYCKLAWQLPEHIIWNNLESAKKGKNPAKLFTWLCQRSLR